MLSQGMGPAPSLTLPHSSIVMKSPRAALPCPMLWHGDQSLSEAVGWGLGGYLGGRGLVAAQVSPGQQTCLPCRSARDPAPVRTFLRTPDELWMSQPEFFHALPLLHSTHRQLSCGFQPLSGPNASNI